MENMLDNDANFMSSAPFKNHLMIHMEKIMRIPWFREYHTTCTFTLNPAKKLCWSWTGFKDGEKLTKIYLIKRKSWKPNYEIVAVRNQSSWKQVVCTMNISLKYLLYDWLCFFDVLEAKGNLIYVIWWKIIKVSI